MEQIKRSGMAAGAAMMALLLGGCKTEHVVKHEVDVKPIKVEPIHVTIDVNVTLRIDRQLDEFFAFEKEAPPKEGEKLPAEQPEAPKEPGAGQSNSTGKGN